MLVAPLLALVVAAHAQFTPKEVDAARKDPAKFTVDEATIQIEKLGPVAEPMEAPGGGGTGDVDPTVLLDTIINIGTKVWTIIDKNKPVVDVKTQYATALPKGITSPMQLAGWRPPKGAIYGMTAKNAYGQTVVSVKWQVLRTYGGSYHGKGKYLTAVTVQPLQVDVLWGYKFSLDASVPDVTVINAGTDTDPVAGMSPVLQWRIQTAIKDSTGKAGYYVAGDGSYQELGDYWGRALTVKVERLLAKELQ